MNRRGRTVQRIIYTKELNADGSERIYSATSTEGKIYLKKVAISLADRRKKRTPVKYPLCSTFCSKNKHRSILILPQHELRKLARTGGKQPVQGFHHMAKVLIHLNINLFYLFNHYLFTMIILLLIGKYVGVALSLSKASF